jgi:HPt (histidine-containing phosphotransfer) domain-containing protein
LHPLPGSEPRAAAGNEDFGESELLDRLVNDRALARAILHSFLEDIPKRIEALNGFLDKQDAKGVEFQAHTIKGAAAAVSGKSPMNMAFELEQAGKVGDLEAAAAKLAALRHRFERLKTAIQVSNLLGTKMV